MTGFRCLHGCLLDFVETHVNLSSKCGHFWLQANKDGSNAKLKGFKLEVRKRIADITAGLHSRF